MKIGTFQSLCLKKEKSDLNNSGFFIKSYAFNLKYLVKNENKVIFLVKKKIGNAVIRNQLKRRIRAVLQNLILKKNFFLMFIVKHEILKSTFYQLKKKIIELLYKLDQS